MKTRTRLTAAVATAAAFLLTPSPGTVGQATTASNYHVDAAIVQQDQAVAATSDLDTIDLLVLQEVARLKQTGRD